MARCATNRCSHEGSNGWRLILFPTCRYLRGQFYESFSAVIYGHNWIAVKHNLFLFEWLILNLLWHHIQQFLSTIVRQISSAGKVFGWNFVKKYRGKLFFENFLGPNWRLLKSTPASISQNFAYHVVTDRGGASREVG
jgi:hypothetical protein